MLPARLSSLVACSAVVLFGCAAPAPDAPRCTTWHPAPNLPPAAYAPAAAALATWNGAIGGGLSWVGSPSDATVCGVRLVADGSEEYRTIRGEMGGDFVAAMRPVAREIVLVPERAENVDLATAVEALVLHEVGHALGLGHVSAPGAVMAPDGGPVLRLTAADIDECRRVGACPSP